MGAFPVSSVCMDWNLFLHVERSQIIWKGNMEYQDTIHIQGKIQGGVEVQIWKVDGRINYLL